MPTTTDLAVRVMKRAGVLDPTENPTAAEAADVVAIMESKYEEMKELGRAPWVLTEIPTRYQDAFISIVALLVAAEFKTLTPEIGALAQAGERTIDALNERLVDSRETPAVDF
jgi:hypothetical protein